MSHRFSRRQTGRRPPCDSIHADDGVDPRIFFDDRERRRRPDHKFEMFCRQVEECLAFALEWQCDDPRLRGVQVTTVVAGSDRSTLVAEVAPPPGTERRAVEHALDSVLPALRAEVARAIHRRRVPTIAVRLLLAGEGS